MGLENKTIQPANTQPDLDLDFQAATPRTLSNKEKEDMRQFTGKFLKELDIKPLSRKDLSKLLQKKTFSNMYDHLSPMKKNLAYLGWAGMWGGIAASVIIGLFKGFKKGLTEPISGWITLIGAILLEAVDFRNGAINTIAKLFKKKKVL